MLTVKREYLLPESIGECTPSGRVDKVGHS